jgi:hypothetical protein
MTYFEHSRAKQVYRPYTVTFETSQVMPALAWLCLEMEGAVLTLMNGPPVTPENLQCCLGTVEGNFTLSD